MLDLDFKKFEPL